MNEPIRPPNPVTPVPDGHLRAVLQYFGVVESVAVVGIRGYVQDFKESTPGGNLVGRYDDVLCLVTPTKCSTYLGNTDPSRLIVDPVTHKGRAVMEAGHKYRYVRGIHGIERPKDKQRMAWVQAGPINIRRATVNGELGSLLTGQYIGCNIHDGGWTTTSSAGCQTVVPEKWHEFDSTLEQALKTAAQHQFWYILTV